MDFNVFDLQNHQYSLGLICGFGLWLKSKNFIVSLIFNIYIYISKFHRKSENSENREIKETMWKRQLFHRTSLWFFHRARNERNLVKISNFLGKSLEFMKIMNLLGFTLFATFAKPWLGVMGFHLCWGPVSPKNTKFDKLQLISVSF